MTGDISSRRIPLGPKAVQSVGFFGCSCGQRGDAHIEAARAVAERVAALGCTVVNGGGPGVMLAATEGANEAHGKTISVYYRPELSTLFEGELAANKADETYEESNYILRTKKLLELADVYMIFNGGTGTISEFGMAWGLARLYFGHHKPLILYGEFWTQVTDAFRRNMLTRPEEYEVFTIVRTPEEAVAALMRYDEILHKNRHDHKNCAGECYLLL